MRFRMLTVAALLAGGVLGGATSAVAVSVSHDADVVIKKFATVSVRQVCHAGVPGLELLLAQFPERPASYPNQVTVVISRDGERSAFTTSFTGSTSLVSVPSIGVSTDVKVSWPVSLDNPAGSAQVTALGLGVC